MIKNCAEHGSWNVASRIITYRYPKVLVSSGRVPIGGVLVCNCGHATSLAPIEVLTCIYGLGLCLSRLVNIPERQESSFA
jgi:hypothetical protein